MIARAVPLDEEQFLLIEDLGKAAMRAKDHDLATKLLAIALAWKVSPIVRFGCTVDESGGVSPLDADDDPMRRPGDVVEMHGYSRKAPCA